MPRTVNYEIASSITRHLLFDTGFPTIYSSSLVSFETVNNYSLLYHGNLSIMIDTETFLFINLRFIFTVTQSREVMPP